MSRTKGHSFERWVANFWRGLGFTCKRGIQSRFGGSEYGDVVGVPGLHQECKNVERFSMWAAMKQAREDAPEGEIPVVVAKRNREKPVVIIDLDEFGALWLRSLR